MAKTIRRQDYAGRDERGWVLYRAGCGHIVHNSGVERCARCRGMAPPGTHKHYLGKNAKGQCRYRAPCGHPVSTPTQKYCRRCFGLSRRKHPHFIRTEDGQSYYRASCGHEVKSPEIKQCWSCRFPKNRTTKRCSSCGEELLLTAFQQGSSGKRFASRCRSCTARYHKRDTFGLSLAEYDQLLLGQGGVCAICQQPEHVVKRGTLQTLSVDHDHASGAVRGLLCQACNTALGLLGDDPVLVERTLHYLQRPPMLLAKDA